MSSYIVKQPLTVDDSLNIHRYNRTLIKHRLHKSQLSNNTQYMITIKESIHYTYIRFYEVFPIENTLQTWKSCVLVHDMTLLEKSHVTHLKTFCKLIRVRDTGKVSLTRLLRRFMSDT